MSAVTSAVSMPAVALVPKAQVTSVYLTFLKAIHPDPSSQTIDMESLKKVLSQDVKVSYLGYDSKKWTTLEGQEAVIACLQEEFKEGYKLLDTHLKFEDGFALITTRSFMHDGYDLITKETYSVTAQENNCVISKVTANQEKVLRSTGFVGYE
jgi:hypothetical protein